MYKSKHGTEPNIFTPKQMLQRLPIALVHGKAGNNSENILNEISQIVYSLYQSKGITKKVYNIIKSTQIKRMGTIFMNSENTKTSKSHVLILNFTDKTDLRRGEKSNLSIYYTRKNIKNSYSINKFKISALTWNDEFELPDESYSISRIQDCFEYI